MIDYTKYSLEELEEVFLEAAELGVMPVLKKMLELGVAPDALNSRALWLASLRGSIHMVELLAPLSNPDRFLTCFRAAASSNRIDVVIYFYPFIKLNKVEYTTILMHLERFQCNHVLDFFKKHPCTETYDDGTNSQGNLNDLLYSAAANGDLSVVKKSIELGASLEDYDNQPLRLARYNKHKNIIDYLKPIMKKDSSND